MKHIYIFLCLFLLSGAAVGDKWICNGTNMVGFKWENGEWNDVIFSNVGTYEFNTDLEWMRENIPVNPHVLRKLHPWKEDLFAAIDCESESGGIRCNNDFYGAFRFVEDARRFQLYYVPGYLEDDRNVTPYMEIGICNYQGKNAWAQ